MEFIVGIIVICIIGFMAWVYEASSDTVLTVVSGAIGMICLCLIIHCIGWVAITLGSAL